FFHLLSTLFPQQCIHPWECPFGAVCGSAIMPGFHTKSVRWMKALRGIVIAAALAGFVLPASADDFVNPKANIAPKAAPQRRNAGEGMPPLPLPATPLRRSEKKREPSPPALVGSITFPDSALKKSGIS